MQYYLVHIQGRMGFEYARNADAAANKAAREFGYKSANDPNLCEEVETQNEDSISLEDVKDIISMGGYVPSEIKQRFGLAE